MLVWNKAVLEAALTAASIASRFCVSGSTYMAELLNVVMPNMSFLR